MISERDRSDPINSLEAGKLDGGVTSTESEEGTSTKEDEREETSTSVRSTLDEFAEEGRPDAPFEARTFCEEGRATSETY